ncbi:MAG: hypothetical protein AAB383_03760 [Patescibacteria group bacterium]
MTKTTKIAVGLGTLLLLIGGPLGTIFLLRDSAYLNENTSAHLPSDLEIEDVQGAPSPLSLGFNNAEQVVEVGDGSTNMVWVSEGELQFVLRSSDGTVTSAVTVATGVLSLPALARSGDLVGVAWTERSGRSTTVKGVVSHDRGESFGETVALGNGSGASLAASGKNLVAVWHDDTNETATQIMLSRYEGSSWEEPSRVDESDAAPLWASVDMEGEDVYVAWRDDREEKYSVWLRRFVDGEWQDEQHLATTMTGDPDVCEGRISGRGSPWNGENQSFRVDGWRCEFFGSHRHWKRVFCSPQLHERGCGRGVGIHDGQS